MFTVAISTNYPHEPPKVKCIPKVRTHPASISDLPKPPPPHVKPRTLTTRPPALADLPPQP
jgi:hypothetical protein